jgi:hypothetical protein
VEERRRRSRREVPEEVAQRADLLLDVVPVDPEEQHVPREVEEAAVEEHAEQQIARGWSRRAVAMLEDEEVVGRGVLQELGRRDLAPRGRGHHLHVLSELWIPRIGATQLEGERDEEVERDVDGDDRVGDGGGAAAVRGVADRDDHGIFSAGR